MRGRAVVPWALAAFGLGLAWATPAHAKREPAGSPVELGVFFGIHSIDADSTLGKLAGMPNSQPDGGVPLGFRLGFRLGERFRLELETTVQLSATVDREGSGVVGGYRGLLRYRFAGDRSQFRPFVLLGAGGLSTYQARPLRTDGDTVFAATAGGGLELGLARHWALRLDGRIHFTDGEGDAFAGNVEVVLGFCWSGGGSCGWYERGRIGTGPVETGQSARDSDEDGFFGASDKCPLRAEDVDGHKDDDGCPDSDDDEDGFDEAVDQCPKEAEIQNGYQDGDGCPDAMPQEIVDFEGILAGVFFRPGTAVFDRRSYDVLDKLAEALTAHPEVRVKVIAHTSAAGPYADLVKLSEERAAAIRQYLIDKGIDGARIEAAGVGPDTPITGNETPEGRAINERIELRFGD